ncbi:MAG: MoaD/ThiS family protein [Chloroflexi bacterium]|nr:MoaD/ThiS family protein [Chloroflexota bacterium]
MPVVVHIPSHMRDMSGGRARVEVPAGTLRSVFDALEERCPGIRELILDDGRIRGDLAVAINTTVTENNLLERVEEGDEVHLVPAIAGG